MSLTDDAIVAIKQMITSGELGPGDRLPPEQRLSERLGLSRSSLREAVKALAMFRVLDVRRGDGTYVTSLSPSLLTEAMAFVVDLHQDASVLELMEVRRILEAGAARRAASRITEAEILALREQVAATDRLDVEELVHHDLTFHRLIASAAGNEYLVGLLDGLSAKTVRARVWRALTQENAVRRTIEEHQQIIRALELRDPELAAAAVTVHIAGVEQWLRIAAEDEPIDAAVGPGDEDSGPGAPGQ